MGYTHYWYRKPKLDSVQFRKFTADCGKILHYCEDSLGIKLADGINESPNWITSEKEVWFNGSDEQPIGPWTTDEEISIPWPAPLASLSEVNPDPVGQKTDGQWFAGTIVTQRVAPLGENGLGSGSYETFHITSVDKQEFPLCNNRQGLVFAFCKTAYRPYDLAVTACLIAFKHHFPAAIVHSDGEEKDWFDGKVLCNNLLGYGMDFRLDED